MSYFIPDPFTASLILLVSGFEMEKALIKKLLKVETSSLGFKQSLVVQVSKKHF
jgi:hypothetical protein